MPIPTTHHKPPTTSHRHHHNPQTHTPTASATPRPPPSPGGGGIVSMEGNGKNSGSQAKNPGRRLTEVKHAFLNRPFYARTETQIVKFRTLEFLKRRACRPKRLGCGVAWCALHVKHVGFAPPMPAEPSKTRILEHSGHA